MAGAWNGGSPAATGERASGAALGGRVTWGRGGLPAAGGSASAGSLDR